MSQKKLTRDELFLVKLAEETRKKGDPFLEMDRYYIGQLIAQNDRSVDNIVRMLAQANFIEKMDGNSIQITQNGRDLAEDLLRN